jgi:hypothetical protein
MIRLVSEMPWECGKGWWPLIEKVAAAIDSFNATHPESPVEVSQIKQKFGGLRIYHYNAPEDLRQLIDEAVAASWHTCEKCGSTTGVTTNLEGYRLTLCPDCRREIKPRHLIANHICI